MDHRYFGQQRAELMKNFDEKTMTMKIEVYHDLISEEEAEVLGIHSYDFANCEYTEVEARMVYKVCSTCDGKGTHVNPSIDSDGLSYEDFEEDPDFKEDYVNGTYDVPCYECEGKRVVPTLDENDKSPQQQVLLKVWQKIQENIANSARERDYERRMGF